MPRRELQLELRGMLETSPALAMNANDRHSHDDASPGNLFPFSSAPLPSVGFVKKEVRGCEVSVLFSSRRI